MKITQISVYMETRPHELVPKLSGATFPSSSRRDSRLGGPQSRNYFLTKVLDQDSRMGCGGGYIQERRPGHLSPGHPAFSNALR